MNGIAALMLKHTLPIMLLGLALSSTVDAAPRSYGPVKEQDTLWTIADRLRPDNSATVQQTMLALYYKNPQAFASNNINSLMKGAVLKAPSSAEARRYQRLAALREARKHNHFWKRGVDLPRSAPPPIPKLKEHTATKRSKPTVVKTANKTTNYPATPRNTARRLARLQAQLQAVEAKNQALSSELKSLQTKQTQGKPNPQLDAQIKKLKLELQELTSVLDQKDNHIKTLQASLKNASETIKAQHADNMRLYDKLKEVSPSSLPNAPSSEGKSELKLTTVEASTAAVTASAATETSTETTKTASKSPAKTEVASNENKEPTTKSVWADEQHKTSTPPTTTEVQVSTSPETKPNSLSNAAADQDTNPNKTTADAKSATKAKTETAASTETAKLESNTSTDTTKPSEPTATVTKPDNKATETQTAELTKADDDSSKTVEAKENANTETADTASQSPTTASSTTDSDIKAPSNPQGVANLTPANDVKTSSSVPVSQMLTQASNPSSTGTSPNAPAPLRGVSPLALAVALISLLFILAMVWRAFVQQREMRRLEEEEARMAERMRRRLEENQSSATSANTATVTEKKDPELDSPELKF